VTPLRAHCTKSRSQHREYRQYCNNIQGVVGQCIRGKWSNSNDHIPVLTNPGSGLEGRTGEVGEVSNIAVNIFFAVSVGNHNRLGF